jgi:hypothetical protein
VSGHESERLCAYLDGELPRGERSEVEAHLAACPACAALLADLTAVDAAATSLPAEPPEGYFDAFPSRVVARLGAASRAPAPPRRFPAWTWAAAAALLLAVVAPLTLRHPAPGTVPSTTPVPGAPRPAFEGQEQKLERDAVSTPAAAPVPAARPQPGFASPPAAALPAAPDALAIAESRLAAGKASGNVAVSGAARVPLPPPAAPAEEGAMSRSKRRDVLAEGEAREEPALVTPEASAAAEPARTRAARAPAAATVQAAPSARQEEEAAGAVSAEEPETVFGRLAASRPRTAVEWRHLRDAWTAFAGVHPDDPRADEARVRAIEAGREAWLNGGTDDDGAAFRREAQAYLERDDAVQKPRVERLLVEPRPTP